MFSTSYPTCPLDEVCSQLKPPYPIIPLWKPVGISTHHFTRQCAQILQVKCAHTGVLDPFAQGVILVLPGEHRFLKEEFTQGLKTYQTRFILGLQTDSLDLLGRVLSKPIPSIQQVSVMLNADLEETQFDQDKNQCLDKDEFQY